MKLDADAVSLLYMLHSSMFIYLHVYFFLVS